MWIFVVVVIIICRYCTKKKGLNTDVYKHKYCTSFVDTASLKTIYKKEWTNRIPAQEANFCTGKFTYFVSLYICRNDEKNENANTIELVSCRNQKKFHYSPFLGDNNEEIWISSSIKDGKNSDK